MADDFDLIVRNGMIVDGTGMPRYREFDVTAPEYQPMAFYSTDEADPAEWLASISGSFTAEPGNGDAVEG